MNTLKLKPGVNLEQSPTLNTVQLAASNLIRFYGGLPQQLGGWVQMTAQTFAGTCRGLHGFADLFGNAYLAIGTEQRLQVLQNGAIQDLTPVIQTDNPAVSFSTIALSPLVTITDGGYSPAASDWIYLATPVSIDEFILFGFYQVQSVVDGSNYVINAGSNAVNTVSSGGIVPQYTTVNTQSIVTVALPDHGLSTGDLYNASVSTTVATIVISGVYSATVIDSDTFTILTTGTANASTSAYMNAGNARIEYLLPTGLSVPTAVSGYGTGDYGAGDYGVGGGGQIIAPGRQWSLDHWGQDLIASPSYGLIYYWQPPTPSPAVVLSMTAPLYNISVFVMPQAQIIVSLGAEVSGSLQPLLIRWCDAGDFTDWNASATNQAGSYLIPTGSILVGGLSAGLGAMFWTDKDVWSITYLGFPLVFGFNRIATECGLIAQRARGISGTFVMWQGYHQFFQAAVGGGVTPMECPVWDFYWNNVDQSQAAQIFCAVNAIFNEMAWHFPLATTSPLYNPLYPIGYVKYNYVEQVWDYGLSPQYQRTAWEPKSPVGNPVGADLSGLLQQHEQGYNANGEAMLWSWQAGYFTLTDGKDFVFSDFLIPSFVTIGNPIIVPNLLTMDYDSQLDDTNRPTLVVTTPPAIRWPSTKFLTYSARGRFWSIGFAGSPSEVSSFSRLGAIRVRTAPDGDA